MYRCVVSDVYRCVVSDVYRCVVSAVYRCVVSDLHGIGGVPVDGWAAHPAVHHGDHGHGEGQE